MSRRRTFLAAAVAAVVVCFVAVGPAGGRTAKSRLTVDLSPLIGTSANGVQKVTFGGKIGLHLDVTNPGPSTVNHVVVTVAADTATFSDASRPECAVDPANAKRMVCTVKQMKAGSPTFSVDLRFNAPSNGSAVVSTPSVSVDAKSQGNPGNNGTGTTTGDPVTTALISSAGNSLVDTYLRGTENATTAATLPQHSQFVMPNSLLGGVYGVETSVQEKTATPLCTKCPAFETVLGIPASLLGNTPFSATNPFTFTVTLLPAGVPAHYYPTGLYHDGVLIPNCSTSPLSATTHICVTSFTGNKYSGFVATGKADQNGRIGFG
jgi:hypothetical protein